MTVNQTRTRICAIDRTVKSIKTSDGAGVNLRRSIGSHQLSEFDPFLLLDEFASDNPDDYIAGFPEHPHRGFETVTYMLDGKMEHRDSVGNRGIIESGGVQWMTAGRGIIHSEMPRQEQGLMRGFQLWVNLPAREKMKAPRYQNIDKKEIPFYPLEDGSVIKIIAGTSNGIEGPVRNIDVQPLFLDIHLKAGSRFHQDLNESHNSFLYVYEGEVHIGDSEGVKNSETLLKSGSIGLLTRGNLLRVEADDQPARLICLSGKPLDEPIVRHGPFVMNSYEEIEKAFSDFRKGRFTS